MAKKMNILALLFVLITVFFVILYGNTVVPKDNHP